MLTNPNWEIHKDYENADILTPTATNGIVSSIQYDYVVTQEMLDWGTTNATTTYGIDIAKVLKKGDSGTIPEENAKKRISVFLDCDTTISTKLNFRNLTGSPWFTTGTGTNTLDIYTRCSFTYTGRANTTYIHNTYYNYVGFDATLTDTTGTLYIGVLSVPPAMTWSGTLIYEDSYSINVPSGSNVTRAPWMTNRLVSATREEVLVEYSVVGTAPDDNSDANYNDIMAILGEGKVPVVYKSKSLGEAGFQTNITYLYPVQTNSSCCVVFVDISYNKYYFIYLYNGHAHWVESSVGAQYAMAGKPFVFKTTFILNYTVSTGSVVCSVGYGHSVTYTYEDIISLMNTATPPVLHVIGYEYNLTNPVEFYVSSSTYDATNKVIEWAHTFHDGTNIRLIRINLGYDNTTETHFKMYNNEYILSTT